MHDVELKKYLHRLDTDWYHRGFIAYNHDLAWEMTQWCKEHVGANNWNYYGVYQKRPVMKFRYPEDALAFRIRFLWGIEIDESTIPR